VTRIEGVAAVLNDIEGTTSSLAFVQEVLFPYSRARMIDYVAAHRALVEPILDVAREIEGRHDLDDVGIARVLVRWIDEDRKAPPLKALQGMIWREGYEAGEIQGHVYADALRGLKKWRAQGLRLAVYSSGSVEAQKLIFGMSEVGDLTPLFEAFFDTAVGAKVEAASYGRIADKLRLAPDQILFLTDTHAEIEAAKEAGLKAVRLVRDGFAGPGEATSFDDIEIG
jgi:enolase-phosphatase E1